MKAKYFTSTILITLLLLTSCNSSDDGNDGVTPESTNYEFFEDAEMVFENNQGFETLSFNPGSNTVFKYFYNAREEEDISDDEYAESIYFQIDGALTSFSYSDEELRTLDFFIRRSCFCTGTGYVFPEIGTVTGTRLSNGNWEISISITFLWEESSSESISRNINGQFSLMPIP